AFRMYGLTIDGTAVDNLSAALAKPLSPPWDPAYRPAMMKKVPRASNPRRIGINGSQHGQPVGHHRGTRLTPGRVVSAAKNGMAKRVHMETLISPAWE